jgi:tetratricopeptide (TPR) repeat protein
MCRSALALLLVAASWGAVGAQAGLGRRDPTPVVRRQLEAVESHLKEILSSIARWPDTYLRTAFASPPQDVQARLNDGQVAYYLQDFLQASIIFFDVVEDPRNRSQPFYEETLFFLADALYQNRNFTAARKYLGEILQNPRSRFYQEALARLVSMALVTGQHDQVDLYYGRLVQSGAPRIAPEIPYLYGKSLFTRGELDRAFAVFAGLPASSPYYFQARFFLGAIEVRRARYAQAIQHYLGLYQMNPTAYRGKNEAETRKVVSQNQRILELTHLALGRIYYELGDLERAAQAYQEVPRQSPLFPEALHELAWTWVKGKNYEKARRALEILMLSRHDLQFIPEAQVLLGDLQLLMERFDEATKTYLSVKSSYEPMRKQLSDLLARHQDPVRFFSLLLSDKLDRLDPSVMLPPLARRWARSGLEMEKTLDLIRDLSVGREQVNESKRIIARLEAALGASDRIGIFPLLREGRAAALEAEGKLLQARQGLSALESLLVTDSLSPQEKAALDAAEAARQKGEESLARVPRTQEEYFRRRDEQQRKMAALEAEVHQLGVQVDGIKAQIVAVAKYRQDTQARRAAASEPEKRVLLQIEEEKAALRALEADLERLKKRVLMERARVAVGDDALAADDRLRKAYGELLSREEAVLAPARGRLSGERRALALRIEGAREQIARGQAEILAFRERLRTLVDAKTRELQRQIAAEKEIVLAYDRELGRVEASSERVAGEVAVQSFQKVQRKLYQLVVKADSGITEIAWQEKERRSRRVKELVQDKKTELKNIEREFQDVLRQE